MACPAPAEDLKPDGTRPFRGDVKPFVAEKTACCRPALSGPAPNDAYLGLRQQAPDRQTSVRDPNYRAHPLRSSIEIGVTEKAANERGHFILSNTRHNQAVASMPVAGQIETGISCEEGRITLPAQENDSLLILQTLTASLA